MQHNIMAFSKVVVSLKIGFTISEVLLLTPISFSLLLYGANNDDESITPSIKPVLGRTPTKHRQTENNTTSNASSTSQMRTTIDDDDYSSSDDSSDSDFPSLELLENDDDDTSFGNTFSMAAKVLKEQERTLSDQFFGELRNALAERSCSSNSKSTINSQSSNAISTGSAVKVDDPRDGLLQAKQTKVKATQAKKKATTISRNSKRQAMTKENATTHPHCLGDGRIGNSGGGSEVTDKNVNLFLLGHHIRKGLSWAGFHNFLRCNYLAKGLVNHPFAKVIASGTRNIPDQLAKWRLALRDSRLFALGHTALRPLLPPIYFWLFANYIMGWPTILLADFILFYGIGQIILYYHGLGQERCFTLTGCWIILYGLGKYCWRGGTLLSIRVMFVVVGVGILFNPSQIASGFPGLRVGVTNVCSALCFTFVEVPYFTISDFLNGGLGVSHPSTLSCVLIVLLLAEATHHARKNEILLSSYKCLEILLTQGRMKNDYNKCLKKVEQFFLFVCYVLVCCWYYLVSSSSNEVIFVDGRESEEAQVIITKYNKSTACLVFSLWYILLPLPRHIMFGCCNTAIQKKAKTLLVFLTHFLVLQRFANVFSAFYYVMWYVGWWRITRVTIFCLVALEIVTSILIVTIVKT